MENEEMFAGTSFGDLQCKMVKLPVRFYPSILHCQNLTLIGNKSSTEIWQDKHMKTKEWLITFRMYTTSPPGRQKKH